VRLTDALVSALELKKGKEAELAWLDAQIMVRDTSKDAKPIIVGVDDNEINEEGMHE
jgi:cleavage and polyadenylation specificity factor subunit 2